MIATNVFFPNALTIIESTFDDEIVVLHKIMWIVARQDVYAYYIRRKDYLNMLFEEQILMKFITCLKFGTVLCVNFAKEKNAIENENVGL